MNTYSFLDFQCAINGPGGSFSLGNGAGVAEEGLTFEPSEPISTMVIGADGTGQHNLSANRSGKITVRLLKTSPVNSLLAQLYAFQTSSAINHGQNTIVAEDTARGDQITCEQVAFAKAPPIVYAKLGPFLEWEFNGVLMDRVLGS